MVDCDVLILFPDIAASLFLISSLFDVHSIVPAASLLLSGPAFLVLIV